MADWPGYLGYISYPGNTEKYYFDVLNMLDRGSDSVQYWDLGIGMVMIC